MTAMWPMAFLSGSLVTRGLDIPCSSKTSSPNIKSQGRVPAKGKRFEHPTSGIFLRRSPLVKARQCRRTEASLSHVDYSRSDESI
ncbi:hypothetical protein F4823DRAFT_612270, partial [Ustulina deusta]